MEELFSSLGSLDFFIHIADRVTLISVINIVVIKHLRLMKEVYLMRNICAIERISTLWLILIWHVPSKLVRHERLVVY